MNTKLLIKNPLLVGALQAIGVILYVSIVGALLHSLKDSSIQPPEYVGIFFMLTLLVFSAATTGALVFGYPAYLALNNHIDSAMRVFISTILSLLLFLLLLLVIATIF